MFIGRRRPLARAAMIGGTAYVAGRAGQRSAYRQQEAADREDYQEQRIAELEAQQAQAQAQAPAAAPPSNDMVTMLAARHVAAISTVGTLCARAASG